MHRQATIYAAKCCDSRAAQDKVNERVTESSCVQVKLCYVEIRRLDRSRVRKLIRRHFAVRAGSLALGLDLWLWRTEWLKLPSCDRGRAW